VKIQPQWVVTPGKQQQQQQKFKEEQGIDGGKGRGRKLILEK
jgi:hypothetical protein